MRKSKKFLIGLIAVVILLFIILFYTNKLRNKEDNISSEVEYVDTYEQGNPENPSTEDMEIIAEQQEEKEVHKEAYEEEAQYEYELSKTIPDQIDDTFSDLYIMGREENNIDEIKAIVQTVADQFGLDVTTLTLEGTQYFSSFKGEAYLISDGQRIYSTYYDSKTGKVYISVMEDVNTNSELQDMPSDSNELEAEYDDTEETSNFVIEKVK